MPQRPAVKIATQKRCAQGCCLSKLRRAFVKLVIVIKKKTAAMRKRIVAVFIIPTIEFLRDFSFN